MNERPPRFLETGRLWTNAWIFGSGHNLNNYLIAALLSDILSVSLSLSLSTHTHSHTCVDFVFPGKLGKYLQPNLARFVVFPNVVGMKAAPPQGFSVGSLGPSK